MGFAKWVSLNTIRRAGFNYWEPSLIIEKNGKHYTVYHAKNSWTNTNIAVVSREINGRDGYNRSEFFLHSFSGKHSGECETEEEAKPFFEELRKAISRKNRVAGRDLERRILEITEKIGPLAAE